MQSKSRCGCLSYRGSHLLSYNLIFIVRLIKRTIKIRTTQKASHIIFIQIYHADITFIILIINIIATGITMTAHIQSPNYSPKASHVLLRQGMPLIKCLIKFAVDKLDALFTAF